MLVILVSCIIFISQVNSINGFERAIKEGIILFLHNNLMFYIASVKAPVILGCVSF